MSVWDDDLCNKCANIFECTETEETVVIDRYGVTKACNHFKQEEEFLEL